MYRELMDYHESLGKNTEWKDLHENDSWNTRSVNGRG
jgi:hypothetical protein